MFHRMLLFHTCLRRKNLAPHTFAPLAYPSALLVCRVAPSLLAPPPHAGDWVQDKGTAAIKWGDITMWDVSGVKDMSYAFSKHRDERNVAGMVVNNGNPLAISFTSFEGLGEWKTGAVTTLQGTFMGIDKFDGASIAKWNTASLQNLQSTFHGASSLNGDLGNWQVSKVTIMMETFYNATTFEAAGLEKWNINKVTKFDGIFGASTGITACQKKAIHDAWTKRTIDSVWDKEYKYRYKEKWDLSAVSGCAPTKTPGSEENNPGDSSGDTSATLNNTASTVLEKVVDDISTRAGAIQNTSGENATQQRGNLVRDILGAATQLGNLNPGTKGSSAGDSAAQSKLASDLLDALDEAVSGHASQLTPGAVGDAVDAVDATLVALSKSGVGLDPSSGGKAAIAVFSAVLGAATGAYQDPATEKAAARVPDLVDALSCVLRDAGKNSSMASQNMATTGLQSSTSLSGASGAAVVGGGDGSRGGAGGLDTPIVITVPQSSTGEEIGSSVVTQYAATASPYQTQGNVGGSGGSWGGADARVSDTVSLSFPSCGSGSSSSSSSSSLNQSLGLLPDEVTFEVASRDWSTISSVPNTCGAKVRVKRVGGKDGSLSCAQWSGQTNAWTTNGCRMIPRMMGVETQSSITCNCDVDWNAAVSASSSSAQRSGNATGTAATRATFGVVEYNFAQLGKVLTGSLATFEAGPFVLCALPLLIYLILVFHESINSKQSKRAVSSLRQRSRAPATPPSSTIFHSWIRAMKSSHEFLAPFFAPESPGRGRREHLTLLLNHYSSHVLTTTVLFYANLCNDSILDVVFNTENLQATSGVGDFAIQRTIIVLLALVMSLPLTIVVDWAFLKSHERIRRKTAHKQRRVITDVAAAAAAAAAVAAATETETATAVVVAEAPDSHPGRRGRRTSTSRGSWDQQVDPTTGRSFLHNAQTHQTVWEDEFADLFDDIDAAGEQDVAAHGDTHATSSCKTKVLLRRPRCCPCCPCPLMRGFAIVPWLLAGAMVGISFFFILFATFKGLLRTDAPTSTGVNGTKLACICGRPSVPRDLQAQWAFDVLFVIFAWIFVQRPLAILMMTCHHGAMGRYESLYDRCHRHRRRNTKAGHRGRLDNTAAGHRGRLDIVMEEQEQEQEQDQGVELQESKSVDAAIPCSSFMENPLAKRTSVSSDTTRNAAVARLEESRRSSTAISGSFIGKSMYSDSAAAAATAAIVEAAPSRTTSTEVGGLESPFACENSSSEDISPVQQLSTYSESRRSAARQSIQANVEEIVSGKEQQKNKSRRIKKFFSAHTSGV